jgi:hypothetical protein
MAEFARVIQDRVDLVHYTSAEAALNILKSKKMWLRNTNVMNDASEVRHGTYLVREYFGGEAGRPFFDCLNRLYDGTENRLKSMYDDWIHDLETNTFVCCLSEFNETETPDGVLSMWRAYGRSSGVALIMNPFFLELDTDHLESYSYPVFYKTDQEAAQMFQEFSQRIVMAEAQLREIDDEMLVTWCFTALQTFGLTLKHPAFREEKEWRIVHQPLRNPSSVVQPITVTINQIPQLVYELPINEEAREDGAEIRIDRLLKNVILGPSEAPHVVERALRQELEPHFGLDKSYKMIRHSNIPLRVR